MERSEEEKKEEAVLCNLIVSDSSALELRDRIVHELYTTEEGYFNNMAILYEVCFISSVFTRDRVLIFCCFYLTCLGVLSSFI